MMIGVSKFLIKPVDSLKIIGLDVNRISLCISCLQLFTLNIKFGTLDYFRPSLKVYRNYLNLSPSFRTHNFAVDIISAIDREAPCLLSLSLILDCMVNGTRWNSVAVPPLWPVISWRASATFWISSFKLMVAVVVWRVCWGREACYCPAYRAIIFFT